MLRSAEKVNKSTVSVGIVTKQTHTGHGQTIDMASLYQIQDQGTSRIPARETLKPAVRNYKVGKESRELVESLANNRPMTELRRIGTEVEKAIKKEITDIKSPKLAEWTLNNRRKRGNSSTNPLVDTGELRKAIGYKIS